MTRKRHGIKPSERSYKVRACVICGDDFKPTVPRQERCKKCRRPRCAACGKKIDVPPSRLKKNPNRVCMKCALSGKTVQRGSKMVAKDGERRIDANGYIRVKHRGRWLFEHRLVMAEKIGRPVRRGEIVHHIDGNPLNNKIRNLVLCKSVRDHLDTHHAKDLKKPPVHHNGRKKKGSVGYVPIGKASQAD